MAPGLRSSEWYAGESRNAYIHRAWMRRGVPGDAFGRPQIAIANTASDLDFLVGSSGSQVSLESH
jgi:dihydroxy-acid dehydratase